MGLSLAITATESQKQVAQVIEAMFGVQPGYTILTDLADFADANSVDAMANLLIPFAENTDSAEEFASSVVANLGITGDSAVATAEEYVVAQLNAAGESNWGAVILETAVLFSGLTEDATFGAAATAFNNSVIASLNYSLDPANTAINGGDEPSETTIFNLTTAADNITGTASDDTFFADVFDNSNTLQSGDRLTGGEGTDELVAEVGLSQAFAISAKTTGVENVFINARSDSQDSNDNNLQDDFVQIDAAEMRDVQQWWTNGSRADVVIEDIRINDDEITKDITFGMRDTDPGSDAAGDDGDIANDTQTGASLHAYFDANSLRSTSTFTGPTLKLEVLDIQSVIDGGESLADDVYNGISFSTVNGGSFTILSDEILAANNHQEMVDAINNAIVGTELEALGAFAFMDTSKFQVRDSDTGTLVDGLNIFLSIPELDDNIIESSAKWLVGSSQQEEELNLHANISPADKTISDELITSEVILDNVGRGSEGGDLEIGTMSTRGGVQQFDVVVEDSSWLTNMRSTNEALQVVNVESDMDARDTIAATGGLTSGYLYIGSGLHDNNDLVGLRLPEQHVATNGLVDVRNFNASTFEGELKVGASLTHNSIEKYLHPIEEDRFGFESDDDFVFMYNLGTNDDFLNMTIHADLTADSDFGLQIFGGLGNDNIQTMLDLEGALPTWYTAQKDIAGLQINSGEGDDIVSTLGAGDFIILAGDGDDAVYADNTGAQGSEPATVDINEVQTLTFTAATTAGDIEVGGLTVAVLAGDDAITVAGKVQAVLNAEPDYTAVDNGDGTVTVTFTAFGDQADLSFADVGSATGVTATVTDNAVIAVPTQTQVQTITFGAPSASGDFTLTDGVGNTVVSVLNGQTDAQVAAAVATAYVGNALYDSVVDNGNGTVTFTWAAPGDETDITFVDTDGTGVSFASLLNQNGVDPTSEQQTLLVTAAATGDGTITVDGVDVTVTNGDTVANIADNIAAAFAGNATYSSVVSDGVDTVTFTFADDTDHAEIVWTTAGIPTGVTQAVNEDVQGSLAGAAIPNIVTTDIEGLNGDKAVWTANNLDDDNQISTLDISAVSSFDGVKGKLVVDFKDITSEEVEIPYNASTDSTSAYDIRQALKEAINEDPELSALLVVKDGPADTFVIQSLIDGVMDVADLSISFIAPDADELIGDEVAFDAAAAEVAYTEAFALNDAGNALIGADSTSVSDNTINAGDGDHDVVVLGTTDDLVSEDTSSNDTVVFTGDDWGYTTIVNFVTEIESPTGSDLLDFTAYLGGDAQAFAGDDVLSDGEIYFGGTTGLTADNGSVNAVVLDEWDTDSHVADVYAVESVNGSTAVSVTMVGTIDLADVTIDSLTLADFV